MTLHMVLDQTDVELWRVDPTGKCFHRTRKTRAVGKSSIVKLSESMWSLPTQSTHERAPTSSASPARLTYGVLLLSLLKSRRSSGIFPSFRSVTIVVAYTSLLASSERVRLSLIVTGATSPISVRIQPFAATVSLRLKV